MEEKIKEENKLRIFDKLAITSFFISFIPWILIGGIIAVADGLRGIWSNVLYMGIPLMCFIFGIISIVYFIVEKIRKQRNEVLTLVFAILTMLISLPWIGIYSIYFM
jgi:hypothetical protein